MRDTNDRSKTPPFSISRYRLAVTRRTLECDARHTLAGRIRGKAPRKYFKLRVNQARKEETKLCPENTEVTHARGKGSFQRSAVPSEALACHILLVES